MATEARLWNLIKDALRDCINAHGPITKALLDSAVKRVVSNLVSIEPENGEADPLTAMVADSLEYFHGATMQAAQYSRTKRFRRQEEAHKKTVENLVKANKEAIKKEKAAKHAAMQHIALLDKQIKLLEQAPQNRDLVALEQELGEFKGPPLINKIKAERHQLTHKLAGLLWKFAGKPEGTQLQDWLLAEKLAFALLGWKPDGKHPFVEASPG